MKETGVSRGGKAPLVVLGGIAASVPQESWPSRPPKSFFPLCPELSHFLLTPFLFPQVISMVMVAVGVYARLMKHAGGL